MSAPDTSPPAAKAPRRRTGRPSKEEAAAGPDARTVLLQAAGAEFVEFGYEHTTSNRIAHRAGFAPQTFYRWYKDKLDIFIHVYQAWTDAEIAQLDAMLTEDTDALQIAEAFVANHRSFALFKRSLLQLAATAPEVRQARAACRLKQIEQVKRWNPLMQDNEAIAAVLISAEQLCQSLAEGEFEDMGLSGRDAYKQLTSLIGKLRSGGKASAAT
jgi:AcrR family transcriptional regulator